jgi:elongation factor Ts
MSTPITPKMVMDLRAATGLPMMKVKEALEAEGGDFEKAKDRLRKEGLKTAESKATRTTGDGIVAARTSQARGSGVIVAVACETEPVKKTPMFSGFVGRLLEHVDKKMPKDVPTLMAQPWIDDAHQTVDEVLRGLIAKTGENMKVVGARHFEVQGTGIVSFYVHHDLKKGAMVAVKAGTVTPELEKVARSLCQHIVFARPTATSRSEVPADAVERERAIYREQMTQDPKFQGKPAAVIDNIVTGKLGAFFKESVLTEQVWYNAQESTKSVEEVLKSVGGTLQSWVLLQVGG